MHLLHEIFQRRVLQLPKRSHTPLRQYIALYSVVEIDELHVSVYTFVPLLARVFPVRVHVHVVVSLPVVAVHLFSNAFPERAFARPAHADEKKHASAVMAVRLKILVRVDFIVTHFHLIKRRAQQVLTKISSVQRVLDALRRGTRSLD